MTISSTDWRTEPAPAWAQPEVAAHVIEGSRYTDPAFAAAEWEGMWAKVWLLMGRELEIPEPGDFQVEDVGRESFIMVRQDDGSVRAFYNVCQHRGSRLLHSPLGSVTDITCPYHGWRYRRDGSLRSVQDPEDFGGGGFGSRSRRFCPG